MNLVAISLRDMVSPVGVFSVVTQYMVPFKPAIMTKSMAERLDALEDKCQRAPVSIFPALIVSLKPNQP